MKVIPLVAILMLASLTAGCTGYKASSDAAVPIGIAVDRQTYSPLMSSTVGIGLSPSCSPAIDNKTIAFRWQADYGHFISWAPPDFKVNFIGPDITTDDSKIYWSYNVSDMDREKPPVHIMLSMIDKASGRVINTTTMDIGWKDRHYAIVK